MGRFNYLPKEIMLEILIRLPTDSVLECKLVCKLWRDIFRLQSFSQLHLARLNCADGDSGKLGFIFQSHEQKLPEFYYTEYDENCQETILCSRETRMDINPLFKYCSIIGSCNGLICFDSWMVEEFGKVLDGCTYVFNPVTREYIILPDFKRKFLSLVGFGYSSSTNEYKFVSIESSRKDSNVRIIQVYTLGSGWRTVGNMDKYEGKVTQCNGAFANGALHWLNHAAGTVLAFSLTDEKFSEIAAPPSCLTRAVVLKALGDFVSITCYSISGCIETWLLKKNKDNNDLSWSEEFTFKCNSRSPIPFGFTFKCNSRSPIPFGFTKSGILLCYENKKIYGYNSRASAAKMDVSFGKSIYQAIPHKNTLISLKELGEKNAKLMEFGERLRSREEAGNAIN